MGRSGASELWLYNPSGAATTVRVRRVTHPEQERSVDLAAHGSFRVADAVSWIGGGPDGDGTIHETLVLTSPHRWGEQVVAVSRSSTPSSEPAEHAAGGTAGHAVTAVPTRLGYTNHLYELPFAIEWYQGVMSQVLLDRTTPGRFRHNIGIVNDADTPLTMTFTLGPVGFLPGTYEMPPEHTFSITVPPHRVQVTQLEPLLPAGLLDTWPATFSVVGERPAIVFLSMVDNVTGDATFVPYTLLFLRGGDCDPPRVAGRGSTLAPGSVARCGGPTPLAPTGRPGGPTSISTPPVRVDSPLAFFHPGVARDRAAAAPWPRAASSSGHVTGAVLDWPPENVGQAVLPWRTVFPDVAHAFPPCAADEDLHAGALELRAGTWLAGWTRTYTTRADGGTYGEMLPLYPSRLAGAALRRGRGGHALPRQPRAVQRRPRPRHHPPPDPLRRRTASRSPRSHARAAAAGRASSDRLEHLFGDAGRQRCRPAPTA